MENLVTHKEITFRIKFGLHEKVFGNSINGKFFNNYTSVLNFDIGDDEILELNG